MKVSVIIPVYNAAGTIKKVLDACLKIDYEDVEIIAVDDGSTDSSADIVAGYPVKLIRKPNGGPASARNAGWKSAGGDICFFTDADCLPDANVLKFLLERFKDGEVGGAGGTYGIANPESLLAILIHAEIVSRHESMPALVDYLGSFNCAYRKKALEEAGGFNEEYKTASAEDNDLSYRALNNGYKLVFDMRAKVAHFHETSLWRYLKEQYKHGIWRVKLYRDHRDRVGGDSYGGIFDFLQPPLAVLVAIGLPFSLYESFRLPYLAILVIYTLMQLPRPVSIAVKKGGVRNLLLAPVTFLRGFARGFGLLAGLLRFGL